jgi:hypothetical protein
MKILTLAVLAAATQPVLACDLCSVYAAMEAQGTKGEGLFGGLAEQFTHFGTVQDSGREIPGEGQYIDSSVSQLFAGYNLNSRLSVQLNVPMIYRAWGSEPSHGTEWGVGDVSLIGNLTAYQKLAVDYTFSWGLLGGVKFPTGDASKLNTPDSELPEGIGGHDLALGSGSYDGVVGTGIFSRWKRVFLTANMQYAIRSEGDFHHQYANDLVWAGGPGVYLALSDTCTLALQAVTSGETKGKDTFSGVPDDDSAETLVYLGPQVNFTWGSQISVQIGADLPVSRENSGTQVMPDYRVRAAMTFRF